MKNKERSIIGDVPHTTADICERTSETVVFQLQEDKGLQLSDALGDRPYNRKERERGHLDATYTRDITHHW
jgi:hypothetical protein